MKMYPSVKQQIPEFIKDHLIYCDCFIDINKEKSCWVLTRNLKFFEFCQKQLMATIDLQCTCLNKLRNSFKNYKGPKGKWFEDHNHLSPTTNAARDQLSLGKYVFHALNIHKIYVIIRCWDKCVVLRRMPDFMGFEIKAEYEDLTSYKIINGTIKYCPVVEFKFQNNEILNTDFEEGANSSSEEDLVNKNLEIRNLLERIRCAKTELQLHKSITDQTFHSVQNNLTLGQPFLRTFKIEEKQILGRCGDIWKRFTSHDDLVIGVPLINQCAAPNLSIIRNLMPVLQSNQTLENSIQLHYRLFQLKLKFDQLDDLETILDCEDEELQEKVWCANGDLQLLPDSFAVLLIKLKVNQIISLKESSLILNYEVVRRLNTTSDTINTTFIMPLQLFLQNINFHKLLFELRSQCELNFLPHTLHQDFLTIAITSTKTNLKITFKSCTDLEMFEHFLQESLDFLKPPLASNSYTHNVNFKSVFYNNKPSSLWFGNLILRMKEMTEDDHNQCLTTWKIYCQNYDKTLLLIKTFLNDHLAIPCNIINISNARNDENASKCVVEFENALRQELQQLQEIVRNASNNNNSQEHLQNLEKLCQLQLNTDVIASDVMENEKDRL